MGLDALKIIFQNILIYIKVNFFRSEIELIHLTLCIVFPTKPNSKHGAIFLINLASEVPPAVDNLGLILVIFLWYFESYKLFYLVLLKKIHQKLHIVY